MHVISNIALISINETLFIELISFLIFLFLINRIMFRPLQATMRERDTHILAVESEIKESENELAALNRKLNEGEQQTIKAAHAQKQTLMDAGSHQADEIIAAARKEILKLKAENQDEVDQQIRRARKNLVNESRKVAITIMERVLDRRMSNE